LESFQSDESYESVESYESGENGILEHFFLLEL
jgi:hypothetical protein